LKGGDTLFKEIILDVCDVGVWQNGGVQENAACSPLTTGTGIAGDDDSTRTCLAAMGFISAGIR
jgi:hypothetical protein